MNDGGGGRPVALGVSMVPWVERPSIDIDLDRPPDKRYAAVPQEAFAAGKRLLASVMEQVPSLALLLADWVRLRTAGRFHRDAVGLPRRGGVRRGGYPWLLPWGRLRGGAGASDGPFGRVAERLLAAPGLSPRVGSATRQRVVIEPTPTRHAQRWPNGNEPLITTNDYRLL